MFTLEETPDVKRPFAKEEHTEDGHYYRTEKGELYPSITTIFKQVEPFESTEGYEHFVTWAMNKENLGRTEAIEWCKNYSAESMRVGTEMHRLAECYLKNEEVTFEDPFDDPYAFDCMKLFDVLKPWLDKNISKVYGTEHKLYSDEMKLAGTVDLVAEVDGEKCIIDFKNSRSPKTPKKVKENHYYEQMCAYAKMWEFCTGEKIETGIILVVSWKDLKVRPFKVKLADYESSLWDWILRHESLI